MHSAYAYPAAAQPHTANTAETANGFNQTQGNACGPTSITLARGKAITLRAKQARVLRVQQGRVWATLAGQEPTSGSDHVLVPGSCLPVPAGVSVVVEHWALPGLGAAVLDWQPAQARSASLPREALGLEAALSARAGLGGGLRAGLLSGFRRGFSKLLYASFGSSLGAWFSYIFASALRTWSFAFRRF